jgi:formylglycine-generating enzyme required for sulfatase activity
VPEVLRIGRQIAEGLAAAHATDLIHRDIKPGNVLLEGGQHRVKITDFGLARAADDASISQSGIIAGTPMYMAPEQALGQTLDQRADLFSLGSVLYQMVTGRPPFRANTTVAVLKRVAEDQPRAIREIIPETPQWLCDIIAKLHAKDPDDRFQSAREVADVLADCEAQLKANAKLKDYSRIPRSKPQRSGRRKWLAVAGAVLLSVIALAVTEFAGVTHLFRGQQGTSDTSKSGNDPQAKAPPPAMAPFDAAQARAHQEAWAKYLGVPVESTNTIGMKFKLIPAGTFTMGSSPKEIERASSLFGNDPWAKERLPTEGPAHEVEITQPFYLGVTEVTVGQFRQFVEEAKYNVGDDRWKNPGYGQFDDCPVVWVSWYDAVAFCDWLSEKEGKKYRLPTEAEWEYSCRAGKDNLRYCFGDDDAKLEDYCWYKKNSGDGTKPVRKKKPNDWGLYDMHGNAWEWCEDNYDPNYYKTSPRKDPPGPGAGGERVVRGSSWCNAPVVCRSAFRHHFPPGGRPYDIGFRVLLVVPPASVGNESGAKNKPASPAITPFTDPDRRAAEYVLSIGGTVRVDGNDRDVRAVAELPQGASRLTVVNLDQNKQVTDAGLAAFENCTNVTELHLRECVQVTDAGLAHLQACKNLTQVKVRKTKVTAAGIDALQKALPQCKIEWDSGVN